MEWWQGEGYMCRHPELAVEPWAAPLNSGGLSTLLQGPSMVAARGQRCVSLSPLTFSPLEYGFKTATRLPCYCAPTIIHSWTGVTVYTLPPAVLLTILALCETVQKHIQYNIHPAWKPSRETCQMMIFNIMTRVFWFYKSTRISRRFADFTSPYITCMHTEARTDQISIWTAALHLQKQSSETTRPKYIQHNIHPACTMSALFLIVQNCRGFPHFYSSRRITHGLTLHPLTVYHTHIYSGSAGRAGHALILGLAVNEWMRGETVKGFGWKCCINAAHTVAWTGSRPLQPGSSITFHVLISVWINTVINSKPPWEIDLKKKNLFSLSVVFQNSNIFWPPWC